MKKLISASFLTSHPHFSMPDLLNYYEKSPSDLTLLRVADKPELLYTMLMAFHMEPPRSRKSGSIIHQLRHLKVNPNGGRAEAQRIFNVGQVDEDLLRPFWRNLVDAAHLYKKDGEWVSEIASTFSYEPDDGYESELEMYQVLECPECGHEEVMREDSDEGLLLYAGDFTHLSGPYCRCDTCDTVVRPVIKDATELPAGADYGDPDAWEYYVEWLQENLELMAKHVEQYGRPQELYVGGRNLDWRGSDGYTTCAFDAEALARAMAVRGDFCIKDGKLWLRQDGTAEMTCAMYHHDVPTGSHLVVQPMWECDLDSENMVAMQDMAGNEIRCQVAKTMLCGTHKAFPYADGSRFDVVSLDGLIDDLECYLARGLELDDWTDLEDAETALDGLRSAVGCLLADLIQRLRSQQEVIWERVSHLRNLIDLMLSNEGEG